MADLMEVLDGLGIGPSFESVRGSVSVEELGQWGANVAAQDAARN